MRVKLFALHDDPNRRELGAYKIHSRDAEMVNREGYGIFWVVNDYDGLRRRGNLTQINFWFAEIDGDTKKTQEEILRACPLLPSLVVESKRGYHVYWKAVDATLDNWKRIVRWGIVPAVGGDPKATDPLRLLRAPGFDHMKNPADPFPVRVVYENAVAYTEAQMLRAFPSKEPKRETKPRGAGRGDTFWQRVSELDGREVITALSGHVLCNGERFSLDELENGNANIIRQPDGYGTGCWVWADGKLGGVDGGSSAAAWLRWYGHDWKTIAEALRELFPELGDDNGKAS